MSGTCNLTTNKCVYVPINEGASCGAGTACTTETCYDGACVTKTDPSCVCNAHSDCDPFNDGKGCNGYYRCLNNTCTFDTSTVVHCGSSGNTYCRQLTCQSTGPTSHNCNYVPINNGAACSDGDKCTIQDKCSNGSCSGTAKACSNGQFCDGLVAAQVSARHECPLRLRWSSVTQPRPKDREDEAIAMFCVHVFAEFVE